MHLPFLADKLNDNNENQLRDKNNYNNEENYPFTIITNNENTKVKFNTSFYQLYYRTGSNKKLSEYTNSSLNTWTLYESNTQIVLSNIGDFVQFKCLNGNASYEKCNIQVNKFYKAFGNIQSLLNNSIAVSRNCFKKFFAGDMYLLQAPILSATELSQNCYYEMFSNCISLKKAPALPATILKNSCYCRMFYNCVKLQTPPELPATTLATSCYNQMFCNCKQLTYMPTLPATNLADKCYYKMFANCHKLTSVKFLPATSIKKGSYYGMFAFCYALKNMPDLIATQLDVHSYAYMFQNCINLKTVGKIYAYKLAEYCYCRMFWCCKSLIEAPELIATTGEYNCYIQMFNGCSNLKYINTSIKQLHTDFTQLWVKNVALSGNFIKSMFLPEIYGISYIPENWSVTNKEIIYNVEDIILDDGTIQSNFLLEHPITNENPAIYIKMTLAGDTEYSFYCYGNESLGDTIISIYTSDITFCERGINELYNFYVNNTAEYILEIKAKTENNHSANSYLNEISMTPIPIINDTI